MSRPSPVHTEAVRRVADLVLARTSYRLADRDSGQIWEDSSGLPPSPRIIIASHHNGWFYQNLLVLEGMAALGVALGDEDYHDYPRRNVDFLIRHLPFFARQHAAGMLTEAQGESELSRIAYHFAWDELWMTGLAAHWIDRAAAGEPACRDFATRFAAFTDACPRVDDGLLANRSTQVRTDDAYLMAPGILRLAAIEGGTRRIDDAIHQVLGFHRRLFDPAAGLYRHIWDAASGTYAAAFWGRGNGWMALAHLDLLGQVPAGHPRRGDLLAAFRAQMDGLLPYQAPDGGWRQVLDHQESWGETSCTGMFTCALARGARAGWLGPDHAAAARRGWEALKARISDDGVIADTCPSTGPCSLAGYLGRPRARDDSHAPGPLLMAAAAVLELG